MNEILEILVQDARRSAADIAAMTGRAEQEVQQAITAYERNGTILRYKAVVNHEKVDADGVVRAWIEVNVTPQRGAGFDAIAERVYQFAEVRSCYLLSGGYDLLLLVEGKSLQQVAGFVSEKLATLEHVTRTATHFMLKAYKEDGDVLRQPEKIERLAISP